MLAYGAAPLTREASVRKRPSTPVTLFERALAEDPSLYRNGGVQWFEGPAQRRCPTASEAVDDADALVNRLSKAPKDATVWTVLIRQLERCRVRSPCLSGACPCCIRAAQRLFVDLAADVVQGKGESWSAISIIGAHLQRPIGHLTAGDIALAHRWVRRLLRKVGVTHAIGGLDISANEHDIGGFEPHWQPHFWLLAPKDEVKQAKPQFSKQLVPTEWVPKPHKALTFDGNLAGLAYGLKRTFDRRVSYQAPDGKINTRCRKLRIQQEREALQVLDEVGFSERLVFLGYRLTQTRAGPCLRSTNPAERE